MKRTAILITFCLFVLIAGTVSSQEANFLTKETFMEMESVGSPNISPDGKHILFTRGWVDKMNDRSRSNLWVVDVRGERPRELTHGDWSDSLTTVFFPHGIDTVKARLNYDFGEIVIDEVLCHVGIKEIEDSWFNLYPNPASDMVTIETDKQFSNSFLKIYNTAGSVLVNQKIGNKYLLDVSAFPSGVYFAELSNAERTLRKRLILY